MEGGSTRSFVYRDKSNLGQAVVHAGFLQIAGNGQVGRALVRVTLLDPQPMGIYSGSRQNIGTPSYLKSWDYNTGDVGRSRPGELTGPDGSYSCMVELVRLLE